MVAAHFGQHGAGHACPSERNNAIEGRATRNGFLRLVVLEQDIQHGLANAYYAFLGHVIHTVVSFVWLQRYKKAVF
jgi:hypothetical protein